MEVSEARRLKELEDENRRLKQMVADVSLDKETRKRPVRPAPEGTLLHNPNQEWAIDFVSDGLATDEGCGY